MMAKKNILGIQRSQISELDELIKQGQTAIVRQKLKAISLKETRDDLRSHLAALARRVSMPNFGLKILHPIISRESNLEKIPDDIRLEFGAALVELGVYRRGRSVLETLDPEKVPKTLLFRAVSFFNQWSSDRAMPLLKTYVTSSMLTDYERLVGKLNLASAFVGENQFTEGEDLLKEIISQAKWENRTIIQGGACELLGQLYLVNGKGPAASEKLKSAVDLLNSTHILPELWARKWLAIYDLQYGQRSPADLLAVKKVAQRQNDFETIRDCDLFLASFQNDTKTLSKIYFGTPYSGYRRRMCRLVGEERIEKIKHSYRFDFQTQQGLTYDVIDGQIKALQDSFFGMLSHSLIYILASDLYKPPNVGNIFMLLYPNEVFDPYSSPGRVHKAINRLRDWGEKNDFPIDVESVRKRYRLIGANTSLFYSRPIEIDNFIDHHFERIRTTFGFRDFKATEVSNLFNINERSSQKLLKRYLDQNLLSKFGAGKRVVYFLRKGGPEVLSVRHRLSPCKED